MSGTDISLRIEANRICPPEPGKTNEWSAVLAAAGILFELEKHKSSWHLSVVENLLSQAVDEIKAYETQLVEKQTTPVDQEDYAWQTALLYAMIAVSALLTLHFFIQVRGMSSIVALGIMDSREVMNGAWYRTISAATLHRDFGHVLSNSGFLLILATAFSRKYGAGNCWILLVCSGMLANATTALLYRNISFRSLGASGMVFAAVGMLTMSVMLNKSSAREKIVPLLAGVALLIFTGTAPGTDLAAHAAGFVWGLLLATPFVLYHKHHNHNPAIQLILFMCAVAIPAGAWFVALGM